MNVKFLVTANMASISLPVHAKVAELAMRRPAPHALHHFILMGKTVASAPTALLQQFRHNASRTTKITVFGDRTSAMQIVPVIKEAMADGVVNAILPMEETPLQLCVADQIRCGTMADVQIVAGAISRASAATAYLAATATVNAWMTRSVIPIGVRQRTLVL